MGASGIQADELTNSTIIKGCLASYKFDLICDFIQTAISTRIPISSDLSREILTEVNKWRS